MNPSCLVPDLKKIIEVHIPGIDSNALETVLLKRVEERKQLDPRDPERVRDLDFSPHKIQFMGGFDPGKVTELFENSVASPDFTNPKFRYLPKIFRKLASRIFPFFALLYEKLSENKVQAFYEVVHEIIAINHRYRKLKDEFNIVVEDNLKLRGHLEAVLQKSVTIDLSDHPIQNPLQSEEIASLNKNVITNLESYRNDRVVCLDDAWGDFASALIHNDFSNVIVSSSEYMCSYQMRRISGLQVITGSAITVLASLPDESVSIIAIPDLGNLTGRPEYLASMALRKLKPGGVFFIRYITSIRNSPFEKEPVYRVELPRLRDYLLSEGFIVEQENIPAELQEGSFEIYLIRRA